MALREIIEASEHDADPVQVGLGRSYATTLLRNVKDKSCALAALRAPQIVFVHRVEARTSQMSAWNSHDDFDKIGRTKPAVEQAVA